MSFHRVCKVFASDGGTPHDLGVQLTFPVQVPNAVLKSTALHFSVFEAIVYPSVHLISHRAVLCPFIDTGTALPHVRHERR